MGASGTKQAPTEEPKGFPDFGLMYYDDDGNIRLGKTLRNREAELAAILEADTKEIPEGEPWFVVSSVWVKAWLAFVHFNKNSPEPGAVDNTSLLNYNVSTRRWEPRPTLKPAGPNMGHYRRVPEKVWKLFKELYPGSGPDIWTVSAPFDDVSAWSVDPAWPSPNDDGSKKSASKAGSSNALFSPKKRRKNDGMDATTDSIAAAGAGSAAAASCAEVGDADPASPDTTVGSSPGGAMEMMEGEGLAAHRSFPSASRLGVDINSPNGMPPRQTGDAENEEDNGNGNVNDEGSDGAQSSSSIDAQEVEEEGRSEGGSGGGGGHSRGNSDQGSAEEGDRDAPGPQTAALADDSWLYG